MKRVITIILLCLCPLAAAACKSGGSAPSSARSGIASATANPTASADIAQAKALVARCIPGTPLDQVHTVHLVFFSSAAGKHGPEVVAARDKVFTCLGVAPEKRDAFKNEAITAAEHQTPKIISAHPAAGVRQYLEFTLPQLVLKYKGVSASPSAKASAS
jgi:hypothetical protein